MLENVKQITVNFFGQTAVVAQTFPLETTPTECKVIQQGCNGPVVHPTLRGCIRHHWSDCGGAKRPANARNDRQTRETPDHAE